MACTLATAQTHSCTRPAAITGELRNASLMVSVPPDAALYVALKHGFVALGRACFACTRGPPSIDRFLSTVVLLVLDASEYVSWTCKQLMSSFDCQV